MIERWTSLTSALVPRAVQPSLVLAILLFNLADAICTMAWIEAGIAEEANLFMEWLINRGFGVFVVVKMAIVVIGLAILWTHKHRKLASVGLFSLTTVFAVLMLYHLYIGLNLATSGEGMGLVGLAELFLPET